MIRDGPYTEKRRRLPGRGTVDAPSPTNERSIGVRRDDVLQLVERMPEEFDAEELMYRIYVLERIEEGERAWRAGQVLSHEDMKREIQSWRR